MPVMTEFPQGRPGPGAAAASGAKRRLTAQTQPAAALARGRRAALQSAGRRRPEMPSDAGLVRCARRASAQGPDGGRWDTAVLLAGRVLGSREVARDAAQEATPP